jgi:hypothetical protein
MAVLPAVSRMEVWRRINQAHAEEYLLRIHARLFLLAINSVYAAHDNDCLSGLRFAGR